MSLQAVAAFGIIAIVMAFFGFVAACLEICGCVTSATWPFVLRGFSAAYFVSSLIAWAISAAGLNNPDCNGASLNRFGWTYAVGFDLLVAGFVISAVGHIIYEALRYRQSTLPQPPQQAGANAPYTLPAGIPAGAQVVYVYSNAPPGTNNAPFATTGVVPTGAVMMQGTSASGAPVQYYVANPQQQPSSGTAGAAGTPTLTLAGTDKPPQ